MKKILLAVICVVNFLTSSAVDFGKVQSTADPHQFSNVWINYSADPKLFDKGFYGIGFYSLASSGFGATFSMHGNWGLVDNGNFLTKFGPMYGYAFNDHVMVNGSLRGFIYSYSKLNGVTATSTDVKVNGGITLTPGITLRHNRLMLNAGFEFGWCHDSDELYKNIEVGIGYNF